MPPQVPQPPVPHATPPVHAAQAAPPRPQAPFDVPLSHVFPEQQPEHDVGSHEHAPATQWSPDGHEPVAQMPSQPLLWPHAFDSQSGTHEPLPHRFTPPAPHVSPGEQPPQSMSTPQTKSWPHLPWQATTFEQLPPSAPAPASPTGALPSDAVASEPPASTVGSDPPFVPPQPTAVSTAARAANERHRSASAPRSMALQVVRGPSSGLPPKGPRHDARRHA
jgi:hypothetical protein